MRFIKIFIDILSDFWFSFIDAIINNLINIANALNCVLPFLMYYIGINLGTGKIKRDNLIILLFIPVIFGFFIWFFKRIADKTGKGKAFPIPSKRFTECDDYGEVSVEQDRIQELLLYVADVEDWLERRGLL